MKGDIKMQPKQYGLVYFDSDPHGANIYVDGQVLVDPDSGENLRTPTRANLLEGRHDFTMTLEGHEDMSGYFDVFVGVTVNVYKRLKPGVSKEGWGEPQPQIWLAKNAQTKQVQTKNTQQIGTGTVKAYSFPDGAEIYVDGRPAMTPTGEIAKTPVTITNVPAGVRQVTFRMPGHLEEMKLVDVEEGAWSDVSATMRPIPSKLKKLDNYAFGFLDIDDIVDEDIKKFQML